jgi:hypothetical protein
MKSMSDLATISVRRHPSFFGMLSIFTVYVDEKETCKLKNGSQEEIAVRAGSHRLQVTGVLWSKTKGVDVNIVPGESKDFECGVNRRLFYPIIFLGALALIVWRYGAELGIEVVAIYFIFSSAVCILLMVLSLMPGTVYYLEETSVSDSR